MLIRVLDHEVAYRAGFILMATILHSACMMVMIVLSINEKLKSIQLCIKCNMVTYGFVHLQS